MQLPPYNPVNPYPWYTAMREHHPIWLDTRTNFWHLFRYDDVRAFFGDHATFTSQLKEPMEEPIVRALINDDPPRHTELRDLLQDAFSPRSVARLEPKIQAITNELLDEAIAQGEMDLTRHLAYPVPIIVIAELLGIPRADRKLFQHWSDEIIASVGSPSTTPLSRGMTASEAMSDYLEKIVSLRRAEPADDLITLLVAAETNGQVTRREVLQLCRMLLVAGSETTTNLISSAIYAFLAHPGTVDQLKANPDLLPAALEEVLRYWSPVQALYRDATRDVVVNGHLIQKGQRVRGWIGSANRDERRFAEADRFHIHRSPNAHIAFGFGIHYCLGAALSRLESRVVVSTVLERLKDLRLADDTPIRWASNSIWYGPEQVPIRFLAAQPGRV